MQVESQQKIACPAGGAPQQPEQQSNPAASRDNNNSSGAAPRIMDVDRRHPQRALGTATYRPIPTQPQLRPILPAPTPGCTPQFIFGSLPLYPPHSALSMYNHSALGLLVNSSAGTQPKISSKHYTTPSIFHGRKQRSGKWIPEEEEYAEALISLFEKGFLTDCENGSTLRSYLSRKLHCPPMRISKKYAGKGIGKMLFICRMRLNMGGVSPCLEDLKILEQRAAEKERQFYKALFPENVIKQHLQTQLCNTGISPTMSMTNNVLPMPSNPLQLTGYPLAFSNSGQIQPSPFPVRQQAKAVVPHQTAPSTKALETALQASFYRALQQAAESLANDGTQTSKVPSVNNAASGSNQPVLEPIATANPAISSVANVQPSQGTSILPETFTRTSGTRVSNVNPNRNLSTSQQSYGVNRQEEPSAIHPFTASVSNANIANTAVALPDFLSGFDKANLLNDSTRKHTSDETVPPSSPALTSQSFDDFHRFLGDDISRLESSNPSQSFPTTIEHFGTSYDDVNDIFSINLSKQMHQRNENAATDDESQQQQASISQPTQISAMTGANGGHADYNQLFSAGGIGVITSQQPPQQQYQRHHSVQINNNHDEDLFPVERLYDAYHSAVTVSETNESGQSSRNRSRAASSDEGDGWDHSHKRLRMEHGL